MIALRQPSPVCDDAALIGRVIEACLGVITVHEAYLCDLDRAIGDGDHGTNMRRGLDALSAEITTLARMPLPEALVAAGTTLVMSIGGAAGPLYGTLLIETGRGLSATSGQSSLSEALAHAVAAVARRGKSAPGEKTLLDVLYPFSAAVTLKIPVLDLAETIQGFADSTIAMEAHRGRASFLGARSRGHLDPGAASCALLGAAICRELSAAGLP